MIGAVPALTDRWYRAVRVPVSTARGIGSPNLRDAVDVCTVDTGCMDVYTRISDW